MGPFNLGFMNLLLTDIPSVGAMTIPSVSKREKETEFHVSNQATTGTQSDRQIISRAR